MKSFENNTEEILLILKEFTGYNGLEIDLRKELLLREIGIDSLSFVGFMVQIEEKLNIEFDDLDFIFPDDTTFHQLMETVNRKLLKSDMEIK